MVKRLNEDLMSDILNELSGKKLTGSQLFSLLKSKYPSLSKRLVYHYLSVALEHGQVTVETVSEEGKYSWGGFANKKYYTRIN
jgi:Fe2+ or Zn2+ uptake regulation protein